MRISKEALFKCVSTRFGPRTIENSHFILCFSNLRVGSICWFGLRRVIRKAHQLHIGNSTLNSCEPNVGGFARARGSLNRVGGWGPRASHELVLKSVGDTGVKGECSTEDTSACYYDSDRFPTTIDKNNHTFHHPVISTDTS
jgi:hypothetical protein